MVTNAFIYSQSPGKQVSFKFGLVTSYFWGKKSIIAHITPTIVGKPHANKESFTKRDFV